MERLVWMLQRFDPETDFLAGAMRIDALVTRRIARALGVARRIDEVRDTPVSPLVRERLSQMFHLDLPQGDLLISYVERPAEWDDVVSETWWVRPVGASPEDTSSLFVDDALHDRLRFIVATRDDARFESWPLDEAGITALSELIGQDLDASSPDYFVTCLRADYATPTKLGVTVSLVATEQAMNV